MTDFTPQWALEKPASTTQNKTAVYNAGLDRIDEGRRVKAVAGDVLGPYLVTYVSSGRNVRAGTNANRPLLGFVSSSGTAVATVGSGSDIYVQVDGYIINSAWAFTPGLPLYVHPSAAGSITQTAPGSLAIPVGWAISSHQLGIFQGGLAEVGSSDAPVGAFYVVTTGDGVLPNDRILTAGSYMALAETTSTILVNRAHVLAPMPMGYAGRMSSDTGAMFQTASETTGHAGFFPAPVADVSSGLWVNIYARKTTNVSGAVIMDRLVTLARSGVALITLIDSTAMSIAQNVSSAIVIVTSFTIIPSSLQDGDMVRVLVTRRGADAADDYPDESRLEGMRAVYYRY